MENEDTRSRVITIENQMAQMMALLTDLANQVKNFTPVAPPAVASTPKAPVNAPTIDPVDKGPAEEVPVNAMPAVIDLEAPPKESPVVHMDEESARRLAKLEERLCMLQGYQLQGFDKLSPFTKVKVPDFYKEPEFSRKYDGTGCPKSHLRYYLNKMARYSDNTPLLVNNFQDSLADSALTWFIELDLEKICTWEDLAEEFLQQYKFNTEIAPTREELVRVDKRRNETFRAYAQRWRTTASQVKPPLSEKEIMQLFLRALPREYFDKMFNNTCINFPAMVELGERIEGIMREGRLPETTTRRFIQKKDKEPMVEVAYIQNPNTQKPLNSQVQRSVMGTGGSSRNFDRKGKAPQRQFTPLPRPMSQLLPMLIEQRLVAKEIPRDNPPKFAGFDLSKSCVYHLGEKGHDVDNCYTLKVKIQNLLDKKILSFKDATPNVQQNPLPNHTEAVNVIFGDENEKPFLFDMAKLEELLTVARCQPKEGNVSREEKMYCLAKMAALGIIQPLQGKKPEGSIETAVIDLSSEKFSCKFAGEVSCSKPKDDGYEPDIDELWSDKYSDDDLECESKNDRQGHENMKKGP
ncbi:uncharacterized protein LOC130135148 [Syzygium oleosum]|uniref:uncharacterized protein LOC130135148 n=1 Tax=Syzygium oleosum TaxID=219896 RepID=UPI0024B93EC2|nr:uncharacterized protein LOC130135148 [Syzygium oleosum]